MSEKTGVTPSDEKETVEPAASAEVEAVSGEQPKEENPYLSQISALEEERDSLKYGLKKERNKRKELESQEPEVVEPDYAVVDDKMDQLRNYVDSAVAKSNQASLALEVRRMAGSEEEAKAILYHYENTIRNTGNVNVDLDLAYTLANKHKVQQAAQKRVDDAHRRSDRVSDMTALAGGISANNSRGESAGRSKMNEEELKAASGLLGAKRAAELKQELGL